jgi:hypothetical protein
MTFSSDDLPALRDNYSRKEGPKQSLLKQILLSMIAMVIITVAEALLIGPH